MYILPSRLFERNTLNMFGFILFKIETLHILDSSSQCKLSFVFNIPKIVSKINRLTSACHWPIVGFKGRLGLGTQISQPG